MDYLSDLERLLKIWDSLDEHRKKILVTEAQSIIDQKSPHQSSEVATVVPESCSPKC